MIEGLKELAEILKELPDMAVLIMAGFLFYKLFIIGSVYGVIKLGINRLHDVMTKPKEQIIKYKLTDKIYSHDNAADIMEKFLEKICKFKGGYNLDNNDIQFIEEAFDEKMKRENVDRSYKMKPGRGIKNDQR